MVRAHTMAVCLSMLVGVWAPPLGGQTPFRLLESSAESQKAESQKATDQLELAVDVRALLALPERIVLFLPDGDPLEVTRVRAERRGATSASWVGELESGAGVEGQVLLTIERGRLLGRIITPEVSYRVVPRPTAEHADAYVVEPRPIAAGVCGGAVPAPVELIPPSKAVSPLGVDVDDKAGPRLDILVLYTPAAGVDLGGHQATRAEAAASVDYFNLSLTNSQVAGSARLVGVEEAPYLAEYSDANSGLAGARQSPQAQAARAATGADVVVLLMAAADVDSGTCGLGYVMLRGNSVNSFSPFGYSIVSSGCDVPTTLSHEVGHNLGLNHDPNHTEITPARAVASYAFGHWVGLTHNFKTVMSYGPFKDTPHFSTPFVEVRGRAVGIEDERHNALALADTLPMGSRFGGGAAPPSGPAAPSNLAAEVLSGDSVRLTWRDAANDEDSFHVEQKQGSGPFLEVRQLPADSEEALVDGLLPGTDYTFRVRARSAEGFSAYSNRVDVTTTAAPSAPVALAADPRSQSMIEISWRDVSAGDRVVVALRSRLQEWTEVADVDGAADSALISGLQPSVPYTFRLIARNDFGASAPSEELSATTFGAGGACVADDETLCLLAGRFELRAEWRDPRDPANNGKGHARTVPGSQETGLFWFFNPENVELVAKMLDARSINQSFWHFYGALSDLEYWISIRDTTSGDQRTYHNQPFEVCGVADTSAFPGRPQQPSSVPPVDLSAALSATRGAVAAGGVCVADDETLCLGEGRFSVQVDWDDPRDADHFGAGHPISEIATEDTGFFWFFSAGNLELAVKLLDARAINGKFWFFWGGLSDVEYLIHIFDHETGAEASYRNEPFSICGGVDINAL